MEISNLGSFIDEIKRRQRPLIKRPNNSSEPTPLVGKLFESWYRGERDYTWKLQPKVFRHPYDERDLTNRFRVLSKSRHVNVPDYKNYGLFLSLMQHYRLPTRLLDWSTSPLVALYFAIEKYMYEPSQPLEDASVWILNPYALNNLEIGTPSTPSIEGWSVRKFLRPAFTSYVPTSPTFRTDDDEYLKENEDKCCAVMGVETDSRIFAQQGSLQSTHLRLH